MRLSELNLPERYYTELLRLHMWMGLTPPEEFSMLDYADSSRIRDILDNQNIGDGRRSDYVRSICSLMKSLEEKHDDYCKLLREYSRKSHQFSEAEEIDLTKLSKIATGEIAADQSVRLLCIILLDGLDLTLKDVHGYLSGMVSGMVDNAAKLWVVNEKRYVASDQLLDVLADLKLGGNVMTYRDISSKFKSVTGFTYSSIRRNVCSKSKPKRVSIKKVSAAQPNNEMRVILSEKIVSIHLDNLSRMWSKLYGDDALDYNRYDTLECYDKVCELEGLSRNTKINYVTAICILLEEIGGRLYNEYKLYQQELQLDEYRSNLKRSVPWFPELYVQLKRVNETSENKSLRVLCLVVLSNVSECDGELKVNPEETGVLRPSDLINTKFIDDGINSHMDISGRKWIIRSGCTKNKVERVLNVSDQLTEGVRKIYDDKLPEYMIVAKNGKQYSGSMSDVIKQNVGYTFDEIRASYFSWRERTESNRKDLLELCRRQGHKYSTAMMNYKRNPEY